jgi:isopentenyl-diphosphate delta-isomerase
MGSKFTIVDENDNIIGQKERADIKQEDIYRVAALWITNSKGDILLAKRALSKKHDPGKWGPAVAGTVEEGETYRANIVKETDEEIGLHNISPVEGPKIRVKGEYNYFDQWFLLKTDLDISSFTVQKEEVAEIKWFSPKELKEQLKKSPGQFLRGMPQCVEIFVDK